jgi:dihydrolipoamide dehydrogenase
MAGRYDLIVIGSGPGGYVCALRAAQLGFKVAVVEKRDRHGGTCSNVGCIPSKALLHASQLYEETANGLAAFGINAKPELDLAKMLAYKNEVVRANTNGIDFLFKKNKIATFRGTGTILAPGRVRVTADGGAHTLEANNIVIATGSDAVRLPGIDIDERVVVSSTGALELPAVPKRLMVVGAGIIGVELGSVWRRLGSEVVVVELLDRILPGMDLEVARAFQRILSKQGLVFKLGHKLASLRMRDGAAVATLEPAAGGAPEEATIDVVLVAVGREPFTDGLGLSDLGLQLDNKRRIVVSERYETNLPGIYAIGDVIAGPMLAHKAEEEGIALAEMLAGQAGHVNYRVIPDVVYTFPEVAKVGQTEEELKEAGIAYRVGKFPFSANGRARVNRATDGFVKVLAASDSDRILGVHIVGAHAGEMIAEAAAVMEFGGSAEDVARICHAHPTLNEAVKEAALAVDGRALHL